MQGYVVEIHDGIDWRYVSNAGFSYLLDDARIYSDEAEANTIAAQFRDESLVVRVSQVSA